MKDVKPVVAVIDDDPSVREALRGLLETVALEAGLYESPREYLKRKQKDAAGCIILDVRLPGLSGLDFQTELARAGDRTPIIFLTGHADVSMAIQAMKAGAVEFLTKPYRDQALLEAVLRAVESDRARRETDEAFFEIRRRLELLSPRERQVMALVAEGQSSKHIASAVGISDITVRVHRRQLMSKMGVKSIAELVRIADTLKTRGVEL